MNATTLLQWLIPSLFLITFFALPAEGASPEVDPSVAADSSEPVPNYENFDVAVYARVYEVQKMADLDWLRPRFEVMSEHVDIDKVYLETHRDTILASEETITTVKNFFEERGIETSGGITLTINESNRFETFCYSNPEHRAWVEKTVQRTARHFDEVILDDFFFTSCKSKGEIEAKGDQSWTEYRLELLDEATQDVILEPAQAVNEDVSMVIKYPNWYEHFQGLGFNLETQPPVFDKLYTGTETRDAVRSAQHLQPYHGFHIFRYFENLKPGHNAGGWVDTGGMRYLDRYAEQLWLTLFAKAPEITLFDFRQLQYPIEAEHRGEWQDQETSLDFDEVVEPYRQSDGSFDSTLTMARAAGQSLDQVDDVLGALGEPVGIKSYRPHHATGEDFLHTFLGMVGVTTDMEPTFPSDAETVLLTESAKHDSSIVSKIEQQLLDGKNVVITTGLLDALEDRGIQDIAEIQVTDRKAYVDDFLVDGEVVSGEEKILIPQVRFLTNDSWEQVGAIDGPNGWPLLHDADYADGQLYVWTIPDNFADLYKLPREVLTGIKQRILQHQFVRLDGPGEISLLSYDNDTVVVESFRDEAAEIRLVADEQFSTLQNVRSGEEQSGQTIPEAESEWADQPDAGKTAFTVDIPPHSYRVFRLE